MATVTTTTGTAVILATDTIAATRTTLLQINMYFP